MNDPSLYASFPHLDLEMDIELDSDIDVEQEGSWRKHLDMSDRFVIEPLPEDEETIHDQLPSPEELKTDQTRQSTRKCCQEIVSSLALLALCLPFVVGLALGAHKANKTTVAIEPTSRSEEVIQFLFDLDASPLPALRDPTFPQHRAAVFVADGDLYKMDNMESPASGKRFLERYALAVFYYQFNGPEWNYQLNFLSAQDHCNWWQAFETAEDSGRTIRLGVQCDEDGFVTGLNLAQNNLVGNHIPDEIHALTKLEILHLYFNHIRSEFPEAVRKMKRLKSIGLMQIGLEGHLPDWIGEMTQLTTLALGSNNLSGEVPKSISNLHGLKILGLDNNNGLRGNLNIFKSIASLEALYLEGNAFTGQLPGGINNWPNLVELDVSKNMIDEALPVSLINHKSLVVLDVHDNLLTGTFPDDIFENTNMRVLAIQDNGIYGTIPDRLGFLKNLQHLDLSWNRLTGTIPNTISMLTSMRYLGTSMNNFEEQDMPDMSKMKSLVDISMSNNNLKGTIPDWIGEFDKLQVLEFDKNNLDGSIPSWIGLMTSLKHILLNGNELTGTIPHQLTNLKHLDALLLNGNSIHGNADAICNADNGNPSPPIFTSDCYPGQNGEPPEIQCRCCSTCCIDGDVTCSRPKLENIRADPVSRYGLLRPNYVFSLANAPATYVQDGDTKPIDPIESVFESRDAN